MSKSKNNMEELKSMLRQHGLRATPARIAVLGFLLESNRPISHLEVTAVLEERGFEKSTLFRTLGDLTDVHLLRKLELGDHVWRFEVVHAADESTHPHMLCVDCGSVQCLNEGQVELKASRSLGLIEDVLLKGHCKDCR
ncbi:MAG: transcriptional repressor [Pirellulaceae bacterium]|nr:transcriptional repressor [Pirellulaceae bacterium]